MPDIIEPAPGPPYNANFVTIGNFDILSREHMATQLSDDILALRAKARAFAQEVLAPNARQWDAQADLPDALIPQLAAAGFLGLLAPPDH